MKIARIESFILGTGSSKDLLFCRVETEDGTYGWGEGYVTAGKETVIAECVKAMAPYVIGRGVFNIRHTGQVMFESGIDWYEEPCLADNLALLAEVRRAVPIPIVTGEALYTKEQFFACLAMRAADILTPDICAIGGISALMDISVMAQPQAVVMSPHNYNP